MQCCATIRATFRKQETSQLWMEGTGEGCRFLCFRSYPIWVQCLNNFVADCSSLHLAVLHLILLLLVQTINSSSNCALSELSKLSVMVTSIYSGIAVRILNHRYIVEVAVGFQIVQKQIEEMKSTHTTLRCSFTDHHPVTHRTVVYQPLLSIRQDSNIPVNHMWT